MVKGRSDKRKKWVDFDDNPGIELRWRQSVFFECSCCRLVLEGLFDQKIND